MVHITEQQLALWISAVRMVDDEIKKLQNENSELKREMQYLEQKNIELENELRRWNPGRALGWDYADLTHD